MTFPSLRDTAHTATNTDQQNHTVNYPASVSAGDTLLCFFSSDGAGETVTFPAGWTKIKEMDGGAGTKYNTLAIAWKKADGTEGGGNFTVTTSGFQQTIAIVWSIQDAEDPTVSPPEVSTGASNWNANPNPDSLTATGGSKQYMWIAVAGMDSRTLATAYPYADNNETYFSKDEDLATCAIAVCSDEVETDTQDPGTFTLSGNQDWAACTVCVYPLEGAPAVAFRPILPLCRNMTRNNRSRLLQYR